MSLHKIRDFYSDYRDSTDDDDVIGYDLYAAGDEKVGSVDDVLVDDEGRFRYLIINTGAWIFGKKVLLPIGSAQIDYDDRRVYVQGFTREQVEHLPEYDETIPVDYDYEEQVRGVYRPMGTASLGIDNTPLDTPLGLYDRDTYKYDRDPNLYNLDERNHQKLKLYEERLIASKTRQKTGEVTIGKRVETETQRVEVPVEKERVVVERVHLDDRETPVTPGADAFQEGEVMRMDIYEETPDIRKEAFVREEVSVRKEVERDTVQAEETIRKEQLNVDKDGNPIVRDA